ncbi:Aste57867_17499 [Aphanomyces stellatus]|uniref:Aste57867_17499 protein n=1 Tax=Aphanomyces stellatus TaxID=120398 RepID=A0A485LBI3_9STRA|nr:hypothetical protein As57867_017439 [Aphanomyces stellatus]VFT94252.1 Aste57867_17499 [Aphanomyces stellatus]
MLEITLEPRVRSPKDHRQARFGLWSRWKHRTEPSPSPKYPARPLPAPNRTYRSVFQQPAIEGSATSPAKLFVRTNALKEDPTTTPTVHDVLTELLRKAKPVNPTAELTTQDQTLQCLAALVFSLGSNTSSRSFRLICRQGSLAIRVDDAAILRNRWQLRIAIKKMTVCSMTVPNKLPLSDSPKPPPDEVEMLQSITGLAPLPQLLDDLTVLLSSSSSAISRRGINMDMGVYHFHKKQFDAALACFQAISVDREDKVLTGYIQACLSIVGKPVGGTEEQLTA